MKYVILTCLSLSLIACSSVDPKDQQLADLNEQKADRVDEVLDNIPEWFTEPPSSAAGIYGVGTSLSGSLQFSVSKAKLQAIYNIASSYNQTVSGNQKSFTGETSGVADSFRSRDTLIIDQLVKRSDVSGSIVEDIVTLREGTEFRTYALMFYPYNETNRVKQARHQEAIDAEVNQSLQEAHKELMQRLKDEKSLATSTDDNVPSETIQQ